MKTKYVKRLKRILDFLISFVMIVILSPLFFVLIILVTVKLDRPAIFRQERIGMNGRIFTLYKFRSMTSQVDIEGNLLPDENRLTTFGKTLRRTSLDEIPELLNILKGDMSFVGPRPLLVRYLTRYSSQQARRHEVKPGLTGLAQVNGRNGLTWDEKFKYDVYYVDNISFGLDAKIIEQTIGAVLKHDGISQDGNATMEEFWGNEQK
jgi:lipopolysaccharide/colanic/teichoic acid biosynthesis glycosyltransferase